MFSGGDSLFVFAPDRLVSVCTGVTTAGQPTARDATQAVKDPHPVMALANPRTGLWTARVLHGYYVPGLAIDLYQLTSASFGGLVVPFHTHCRFHVV
jgi:hypothetical protein